MSEFIDPMVLEAVEGNPLPDGHQAKTFAAGLPGWHPVRRLFSGESQWLGRIDAVYCLLRLFSEVYADHLAQAGSEGLLQAAAAPDCDAERAAFEKSFPDDVLYQGRAYKLSKIHGTARSAIETMTSGFPPLRTVGLDAFDRTFATLVRAVRWS